MIQRASEVPQRDAAAADSGGLADSGDGHSLPRARPRCQAVTAWEDLAVWSVVIPVKRLSQAKTRLAPALGERRTGLALAFACDTVAAAAASPLVARVFVVTADDVAGAWLAELGARIVADDGRGGLNGAIEAGRRHALETAPAHRVAALTADLPALRTGDLTAVLAATGPGRAFVPDALGTGTTLLLSDTSGLLAPTFGPQSRSRHETSGAAVVADAGASLRQDVDTADDLAAAVLLGLGERTNSLLAVR